MLLLLVSAKPDGANAAGLWTSYPAAQVLRDDRDGLVRVRRPGVVLAAGPLWLLDSWFRQPLRSWS